MREEKDDTRSKIYLQARSGFVSNTSMIDSDSTAISVTDVKQSTGLIPIEDDTSKKGWKRRSIMLTVIDIICVIVPVGLALYLSTLVSESPIQGADDAEWYLMEYGYGFYMENLDTLRIIYGACFGWNAVVLLAISLLSAREYRLRGTPSYRKAFLVGYTCTAFLSCGFWTANLCLYLFPLNPPAGNLVLFLVELFLFISVAVFASVVLIRLRALYRIYRRCDYNPRYRTFMLVIFIFMLLVNIPEITAFALCAHNFTVDTPNPNCPEWLAHVPLSYLYYIVYTSFFAYYTYHIRTYPDRNVYLSNLRLAIISTLWSVGTVATFYGANSAQMDARAFCGYTSLLSIYTIEMYGNTLYDEYECEYRGAKPLSDEDEKDLIAQRNKTLAGVGYYMNNKELYDILLEISKARYCDEIVMFLGGLCAAHRMTQTALDPRRSRNNSSTMKKARRSQDSLAVSTGQIEEEDEVETCAKKYYLNDLVALYEQFISTDGSHCVNVTHVLRVNVESALNDCKRAAHNSDIADAKRAYASKELAANMDTLAVNTIRLLSHSGVWEQFKNDERVLAMESRKEAMQKYGLSAANTSAPLSPSRRQSAVV